MTEAVPGAEDPRPDYAGDDISLRAPLALADLALVATAGLCAIDALAFLASAWPQAALFVCAGAAAFVAMRELKRRRSLTAAVVGLLIGALFVYSGTARSVPAVQLSTFGRIVSVLVGAAAVVTCGRAGLALYERRPPVPTPLLARAGRTLVVEAVLLVLVGNVPYLMLLLMGVDATIAVDVVSALMATLWVCRAMLTHAPRLRDAAAQAHAEAMAEALAQAAARAAATPTAPAAATAPSPSALARAPAAPPPPTNALGDDLVLELDDVDAPPSASGHSVAPAGRDDFWADAAPPMRAAPPRAAPIPHAEPPRLDPGLLRPLPAEPEPFTPLLVSPQLAPLERVAAPPTLDPSRLVPLGAPAHVRRDVPSVPSPPARPPLARAPATSARRAPDLGLRTIPKAVLIASALGIVVGLAQLLTPTVVPPPAPRADVAPPPASPPTTPPPSPTSTAEARARAAAERAERERAAALVADGAVMPLGGQPLVWWRRRLGELRAEPTRSATTTPVLLTRAERLGLRLEADRFELTHEVAERRRRAPRKLWISTGSSALDREPLSARADVIERRLAARITRSTPGEGPHLTLSRTQGPRAALRLVFDLPPDDAPDAVILDRLALHAVLVANAQAPADLAKRLHAIDGDLRITQGATQLAVTVELPSSELEGMLALLLRVFCKPTIVPARLEAARAAEVVALPIGRAGDPASGVEAALMGWQPFSPREESHVDRMRTIEDVAIRRRVGDIFRVGQLHVAVAGDVDTTRVAAQIAAYGVAPRRGELRAALGELAGRHQRLSWVPRVAIAYPIAADDPAAAAAALLAAEILDERLFHALRDAGEAYATYVQLTSIGRRDAILVIMPSAVGETEGYARSLESQLRQLGGEPVDEATLARARGAALHALEAALDAPVTAVVDATTPVGRRTRGPGVAQALLRVRAEDLSALLTKTLVVERAGTLEFAPPLPRPMPTTRSRGGRR